MKYLKVLWYGEKPKDGQQFRSSSTNQIVDHCPPPPISLRILCMAEHKMRLGPQREIIIIPTKGKTRHHEFNVLSPHLHSG